jgi:hypothetical protein
MNRGWSLRWQWICALWLLLSVPVHAAKTESDVTESAVKAAFIYNFTKFVEWPSAALAVNDPLQLCILGQDDTSNRLRQLHGREAQGHTLQVRQLTTPEESSGCHLLFVTRNHPRPLPGDQKLPLGNGQLTVSDAPGFIRRGGMIELFVEASRVQFMISVENAQSASLKISARMLQLSRTPRLGGK